MVFLFLKFPAVWDKVFALVTGLFIIIAAFRSGPTGKMNKDNQVPYVEHKHQDMRERAISEHDATNSTPTGNITSTDATAS